MAENLPEPKSRKESNLAKAAGMDVTVPEAPESREEQYLAAIAEGGGGGGGGSYTAGDGIDITDNVISVDLVQTTGTSTTDVMSQDATTKMIYPDIVNSSKINIGENSTNVGGGVSIHGDLLSNTNGIAIGVSKSDRAQIGVFGRSLGSIALMGSVGQGDRSISIGSNAFTYYTGGNNGYNVAIGTNATASDGGTANYSVALGAEAKTTRKGEINVGTGSTTNGYNATSYRVIGGVHDGQNIHDAATVAQGNTLGSTAPTTATVGVVGQLYTDTTANKLYHCTAIDTSVTPNTYTWEEVGAGGGGSSAIELTEDSFNANYNDWSDIDPANFNCVAMWLLPFGNYYVHNAVRSSSEKIPVYISRSTSSFDAKYVFSYYILTPESQQSNELFIYCYGSAGSSDSYGQQMIRSYKVYIDGTAGGTPQSVVTNEYLNDNIKTGVIYDTPTSSTGGTAGRLYRFNNNGTWELWICLDDAGGSGSSYTWKQVNLI